MDAQTLSYDAEQAYGRQFDPSLIVIGKQGKPGQGWGRQVFYGTQYLGRIDGDRFITDSTNWPQAAALNAAEGRAQDEQRERIGR